MKNKWFLIIPALLILFYMIFRELTTSYFYKNSLEALLTACIFFLYIGIVILYKRKFKN